MLAPATNGIHVVSRRPHKKTHRFQAVHELLCHAEPPVLRRYRYRGDVSVPQFLLTFRLAHDCNSDGQSSAKHTEEQKKREARIRLSWQQTLSDAPL